MDYIKVFTDFAKSMEILSDAERGRLFMAMLEYAETGTAPDLRGNERFIWPTAKLQIDRNATAYKNTVKKNRENGKNGGRPKKPNGFQENPKNPLGFEKPKKSQDKDKEKDKDKYNIPPLPPKGGWDVLQGPLFQSLLEFEEMRKKIKKPMTDRAKQLLLGKLRKLSENEETQIAILEQSILHGWQDVYPLKEGDMDGANGESAAKKPKLGIIL